MISSDEIPSFSVVGGGAAHKLFSRFARNTPEHLYYRTAVICALICWLPLLILSVVEGVALGDRVAVPFLYDIAAYTRFLIAVPLLVIAESMIGPKLSEVGIYFVSSGRIAEEDFPAYADAVAEAVRLRDSKWAEAGILVIVAVSTAASLIVFAPTVSNWRWMFTDFGIHHTLAAWWYVLVSIPLFQFLLYRWFLRMFIWSRFLYRISRLKLKLVPTHPDRAGGIAFVGANQRFFGIIAFSLGTVFAGNFGNEILYEGLSIKTLQVPAFIIAILLVFVIQLPGFFFYSMLRKVKRRGVFEYGELALQYTSDFQEKWLRGQRDAGEEMMGSGDIQSLADLGNSYSVIEDMKIVPFSLKSSLWLAAAFLFPILPLFLTVMPLEEILETVVKVLA